ncbi:MAG TPA: site-2 protease family protein [Chthonomonadales bacterium]|nr:site-2 protease family protein [Chthonomonadales bacterium]
MILHFDAQVFLISLIVIVLSIALHEFGHAIAADRLGDPGPRADGRVTLWPDKHFEPVGFIMIVVTLIYGFGLGWGKPVVVNRRAFRNPQRDMIIVTACGPLMNLILALLFGCLLRFLMARQGIDPGSYYTWIQESVWLQVANYFILINLALMFFNFIPIPPLDGSKILAGVLPYDLADRYERFMAQWGLLILMLVVFFAAGAILEPAVNNAMAALLGVR